MTHQIPSHTLSVDGFLLVDDGTLDTVLYHVPCGRTMTFDTFSLLDGFDGESVRDLESYRIASALDFATQDHDCPAA